MIEVIMSGWLARLFAGMIVGFVLVVVIGTILLIGYHMSSRGR